MFSKNKRFSQAQVITKATQPRRNSASPFYLTSPLSDLKQNLCNKEGTQRNSKYQSTSNQKNQQHLDRIQSRSPSLQSRRKRLQVNNSTSFQKSQLQEVSITLPSNPRIPALFLEDNQSIRRRVSFAEDKENDYFERTELNNRNSVQGVGVQQVCKQVEGSFMSEEPDNIKVNDDKRNDLMLLWKNTHENNNELNLSEKAQLQSGQKCQENSTKQGYSFEKQSLKKYNELRNIQKEKKLDDKKQSFKMQQNITSSMDAITDGQELQNKPKRNEETKCLNDIKSNQKEQTTTMEQQMISPNKLDNKQLLQHEEQQQPQEVEQQQQPQEEEQQQSFVSQEPASVCRLSNSSAKSARRRWFQNNTNNDLTPSKDIQEEQKILVFRSCEKPSQAMHKQYESLVEELERMKQYYSSKDRWQQEYLNNMLKQNLQLQHDYLQAQEHEELLKYQHEQIVRFKGNLRIYCRIKPLGFAQDNVKSALQINQHHQHVIELIGDENNKFFFDHVFDGQARQQDIFQETQPFIQSALNGDQVCLIAYGQTGSGKTYTMEGDLEGQKLELAEDTGILPRTAFFLFQEKQKTQTHKDMQFSVGVIEIYCEELRDLLQTDELIQQKLSIVQQAGRTKVLSQHFQRVNSAEELVRVLKKAAANRTTDSTTQNAVSSRSHCIYQIKIVENEQEKGCISIVDLAGSESFEATSNKRESAFINKSLTTLKRIITLLGDKNSPPNLNRIPYRESKLTRLLQDSLGGNSKTLVFVMVCPSETNFMQTKESLKFISKASF